MKREARIIFPFYRLNERAPVCSPEPFVRRLIAEFGGATVTKGRGSWQDEDMQWLEEDILIADIACEDDALSEVILKSHAKAFATEANQQEVYLRLPSGEVVFIHQETPVDTPHKHHLGSVKEIAA
jgi:hypothetical protein